MRILLVNPSQYKVYGNMSAPLQLHMGLAYLGAVLKKEGHSVTALDMDADCKSLDDFTENLRKQEIDIVGVTVTTPTLSSALEIAEQVKKVSNKTKVAFGGIHASVMPRETISYPNVDFVIKGEGELTFSELAQALENSRSLNEIKGLLFKEGGRIIENEPRELIRELDSLPFVSRNLFKKNSYTYPDALYAQTAPIITSRGCPGGCTYCNASSIFGRGFRARSAKNVVDEIEYLIKNYNIKEIHIWDDNFVTQKMRVFQIKNEIRSRRIKTKFAFPNGIRADFLDKEVLQALKDMGTYSIAIGVESGSQKVLDMAKKGIKLERIVKAFELAKGLRFETWAFFMFGLPGEDRQSATETINFAKQLNPDIAKFHILKPYPGTEVYKYLKEHNLLLDSGYDNYGIHTAPVHRLSELSDNDLLALQKKAYQEFYFRPGKIFHQVLRIKSFNRLWLNVKSALAVTKIAFKK